MERSTLPRTLGIFALVWAILCVLGGVNGCCGLVAMEAMGPLMQQPMKQMENQLESRKRELTQIDADIAILKAGGNPMDKTAIPPSDNGAGGETDPGAKIDGGDTADADEETEVSVFDTYNRTSLPAAQARRLKVKREIANLSGATAPMGLFKSKELRRLNRISAGFSMFNGLVLGVLLLVGGIGMLSYKPWSYALSTVALVGKILLNAVELGVTILVIMPRMEPLMDEITKASSQGPMAGFNQGMMAFSGIINYVISGIAIFVPVLILLLLRKRECREALLGGGLQRHDGTELPYREDS